MNRIKIKYNKRMIKRFLCMSLVLVFTLTCIKLTTSINAQEDIFYASDFVNNPNGGYLNATFEYGSYPQTKIDDVTGLDPSEYVEKDGHYYLIEPIEWRVLSIDEDNNEVFVLSEKILDSRVWDDQDDYMYTWDGKNYEDDTDISTYIPAIRTWLNDTSDVNSFINTAFTSSEQEKIIPKEYEAYNDDLWQSYDGTKVEDKITLLSSLETVVARDGQDMATKYGFDSNYCNENVDDDLYEVYSEEANRLGIMTDYSLVDYYWSLTPYTIKKDDSINNMKKTGIWWTRSRFDDADALDVYDCGGTGVDFVDYSIGVRPALSLNLSSLQEKDIEMNYGLRGSYTFEGYSYDNGNISTTKPTGLKLKDIKKLKVYFSNEKIVDTNKTLTTWYANAMVDNENHGYINLGRYPKTKVRDEYIINKLNNLYVSDMAPISYGYNEYIKKGDSYYQLEPITWQVLKFNDDGSAFLLTKDVIDSHEFDSQNTSYNKWDDASNPPSLRTWLNNDFYNIAFTDDEKDLIENYNYEIYDGEDGDGDTVQDKVTLLSRNEIQEIKAHEIGFASDNDRIGMSSGRIGHGTDYALSNYGFDGMSLPLSYSMTYSENSIYWWTRSRFEARNASIVYFGGGAYYYYNVNRDIGVRPALSLNLSSLTNLEGDGTIESPYTIGKYKIEVQSNGGGNVTPCNDYFEEDEHILLEAIPNDGFKFDGWYEGNNKLTSNSSYEFDVSKDINIEARFKTTNNKTITNFTKGNGYVSFGSYPQTKIDDITGLDTSEYVELNGNYYLIEPITWQVLDVENTSDGKTDLLLFSNKILESMKPNGTNDHALWSDYVEASSDNIRGFLNTEFITNAFSDVEKTKITTSNVEAYDEMYDGVDTQDKVFLLSVGDVTGAMNIGDKYGFAPCAWTTGDESNRTSDISDYAKVNYDSTLIDGDTYSYWLRDVETDGNENHFYINNLGQTHFYYEDTTFNYNWSYWVSVSDLTSKIGVKPALRVTLDNSNVINGGNGTLSSPYTLGEVKYTVSFVSNGGIGTMNDETNINPGYVYTIPTCTFTRDGYTFDYWSIDGVKVTTDTITIDSDITLKANWKQNSQGGGSSSKKKKNTTPTTPITPTPIEEPINEIVYKSYMNGYEDKTFRSNENITRAELATVFSRVLNDNIEKEDYKSYASIYSDLTLSWYQNYIGYLTTKDVFEGYEDKTFKPQNNMTRAEFAKCIVKMYKLKMNKSNEKDNKILEEKWYKNYIDIMSSNNYIDNDFINSCSESITRKEVCKIVNAVSGRTVKTKDTLTSEEKKFIQDNFIDLNENDTYYYDIVTALLDLIK